MEAPTRRNLADGRTDWFSTLVHVTGSRLSVFSHLLTGELPLFVSDLTRVACLKKKPVESVRTGILRSWSFQKPPPLDAAAAAAAALPKLLPRPDVCPIAMISAQKKKRGGGGRELLEKERRCRQKPTKSTLHAQGGGMILMTP